MGHYINTRWLFTFGKLLKIDTRAWCLWPLCDDLLEAVMLAVSNYPTSVISPPSSRQVSCEFTIYELEAAIQHWKSILWPESIFLLMRLINFMIPKDGSVSTYYSNSGSWFPNAQSEIPAHTRPIIISAQYRRFSSSTDLLSRQCVSSEHHNFTLPQFPLRSKSFPWFLWYVVFNEGSWFAKWNNIDLVTFPASGINTPFLSVRFTHSGDFTCNHSVNQVLPTRNISPSWVKITFNFRILSRR